MAVGIIYNCDVCGCEVTSYSGYNHDGTLIVSNGREQKSNFYLCPSCVDMVVDYITELQEENGLFDD
jgi:hypothetical protein